MRPGSTRRITLEEEQPMPINRRDFSLGAAALVAAASLPRSASAQVDAARRWIESEFQPSTLSQADQMREMEWFIRAAQPFRGREINVVSETITTHEYESRTLARAFNEITGIQVRHDIIQEGDV